MTNMNMETASQTTLTDVQISRPHLQDDSVHSMSPLKLARLNYALFLQLHSLGSTRDRICSVLSISDADFDYLRTLGKA